jgi:hypothetical protein
MDDPPQIAERTSTPITALEEALRLPPACYNGTSCDVGDRALPFVVDLCCRDVTVAEQGLDFGDVDAGVQQKSSCGGPERMGRVAANRLRGSVGLKAVADRAREPTQVREDHLVTS